MNEIEKINEVLENASECPNICGEMLVLAQFEEEYKRTDFFKKTKISLKELYHEHQMRRMLTFKAFVSNIKEIIADLDVESLKAMLEQINTENAANIRDMMNKINESDLMKIVK